MQCPRTFEQHCHVSMYQFRDLDTLFEVDIPQQTNENTHSTNIILHNSADVASGSNIGLSHTPIIQHGETHSSISQIS